jgi:sterol desaturase/sphingolipid hydroxylase (fatty acid hydroxylase superfamily)
MDAPTLEFWLFFVTAPLFYLALLAAEFAWPARRYPPRRWWVSIGILFYVVAYGCSTAAVLLVPPEFLSEHRLLDGARLGTWGGVVLVFVVFGFIHYWYHRLVHRFDFTWRVLHQWHHIVPRMDVSVSFWAHPIELVFFALLGNGVKLFVLGVDPYAAAITSFIEFFYTTVSHWNVRTPTWFRWFMLRPEEHVLHHEKSRQPGNYGSMPYWDWLFGTYRAPAEPEPLGFEVEPTLKAQWDMFLFRDISSGPPSAERPAPGAPRSAS